ncbi:hypothetical protein MIB92_09495 [Aestuariirhabdus sp. Z084]|uniref:hypothetical protein n=1 Tax=Aestuariirhabdus haliotis TaxID=2918751 RepID=UPI00201B40ED|nr:hypothetical protein [Aestuariirhabdus haliotis]MCL6415886.1 hypothetical protein [Aestuariirhabdus haliotis]MCL6419884.1 hypothetical protein [Aestuariirhabdus haliotis]
MKFAMKQIWCLIALMAFSIGSVQAADMSDEEKFSMQLVTASYMLRFYSYLGNDYHDYAGSDGLKKEQDRADGLAARLSHSGSYPELQPAWTAYRVAIEEFELRWQQQQYPDWYSLQDVDKAHRKVLELLHLEVPLFDTNLSLLDMMEFYMHNSTALVQANLHPRGVDYNLAAELEAFDNGFESKVESGEIDSFASMRWKYIKPLLKNTELRVAPMTMMRHGSSLSLNLGGLKR